MKVGGIAYSFPTHYYVCFHDSAELTISAFYCSSLIYGNHYVSVPAETSCSLVPNIKKHCTSQCFVLDFLNLIFERYKKFRKGPYDLEGGC